MLNGVQVCGYKMYELYIHVYTIFRTQLTVLIVSVPTVGDYLGVIDALTLILQVHQLFNNLVNPADIIQCSIPESI